MFKVNKTEWVLWTKYRRRGCCGRSINRSFFLGGGLLSMLIVFAIIHCLGNRQLLSGVLSWKYSISSQWPCFVYLGKVA